MSALRPQQAINEALKGNWKIAIEINRQILKETPNDIEALNRLAFALCETGFIDEARKVYKKVLLLNRFNPIAIKNLKRLSVLKKGKPASASGNNMHPTHLSRLFLEEIGKTKVVSLINLAEARVISTLHPTNPVVLVPRRQGIAVTTTDSTYIGALPDDIARRLFILMKGGNEYETYVKSQAPNEISIFIRERTRKAKFKNQPSFLGKGSAYYPFVREEVFAEEGKPDVTTLEDLDEEEEEKEEEVSAEPAS